MRPALLLTAVLAGCAAPAPLVVAPPAEVTAPPRLPPVTTTADPPVVTDPVEPRGAAREEVVERRVYEEARVAEWTLANGVTVVYAWDVGADQYTVRLDGAESDPAPSPGLAGWGALRARVGSGLRTARGSAVRLDSVLSDVAAVFTRRPDTGDPVVASAFDRPSAFTVVIHGARSWTWVEGAVGRTLSRVRGRASVPPLAAPVARISRPVTVDADDLAAVAALDALVRTRTGEAALSVGPGGRRSLQSSRAGALDDAVPDAAIRAARSTAAAEAESGGGVVDALARLYALPGRFRPVRPPQVVRDLPGEIGRTPPERVRTLLDRLRSALPSPSASDE